MKFGENVIIKNIGEKIGFFIGFLIFSSVFYLILRLLNKIPSSVKYWYIVIGVFILYIVGLTIKLVIKK